MKTHGAISLFVRSALLLIISLLLGCRTKAKFVVLTDEGKPVENAMIYSTERNISPLYQKSSFIETDSAGYAEVKVYGHSTALVGIEGKSPRHVNISTTQTNLIILTNENIPADIITLYGSKDGRSAVEPRWKEYLNSLDPQKISNKEVEPTRKTPVE